LFLSQTALFKKSGLGKEQKTDEFEGTEKKTYKNFFPFLLNKSPLKKIPRNPLNLFKNFFFSEKKPIYAFLTTSISKLKQFKLF